MSYRNPQIIVDRSAEIYAQGAAKTGALFAQGIASYFENKNKTAAAQKKKDDAYKLGLNGIALKADKALADATTTIQGTTLYGDIQDQARARLDGSEGQIGIIEKQAQLSLNPDLSSELSKQYRKDIADYQKWEANIVEKVSSTMADLEPIKDLTATTIGVSGKQDFVGEGNEKFSNFAVAYALDGKQVPGVESTRGVEGDLIKFNINIDPKNETIKKFIESGALNVEDLKATEDGKYQLNWERNLNNWDGGLIADVPDSMDIQSALEEGGLIKDGVITQEFTTGVDYDIKPIKNTGYQRITEKIFFDPKLITENPTVQAEFKKHAAGFLAPGSSLDEQMLGLRNNFNYSGSRQDWQDMTPEKQEEYIITELEEQAVEQAMQGDKDFKVQFDQKSGKYFTYGKTTERKTPEEDRLTPTSEERLEEFNQNVIDLTSQLSSNVISKLNDGQALTQNDVVPMLTNAGKIENAEGEVIKLQPLVPGITAGGADTGAGYYTVQTNIMETLPDGTQRIVTDGSRLNSKDAIDKVKQLQGQNPDSEYTYMPYLIVNYKTPNPEYQTARDKRRVPRYMFTEDAYNLNNKQDMNRLQLNIGRAYKSPTQERQTVVPVNTDYAQ